jgi:hypothetical protein
VTRVAAAEEATGRFGVATPPPHEYACGRLADSELSRKGQRLLLGARTDVPTARHGLMTVRRGADGRPWAYPQRQ